MPFLSSVDNLLWDAHIIFHKGVVNFKIEHKTCYFWLGVQYPLKLDSYWNASVFFNAERWAAVFPFQLNATVQLQNTHAECCRQPIDPVSSVWSALKVEPFFQLVERHCSWDSMLILIYQTDAHDLTNKSGHGESGEKMLVLLVWIQLCTEGAWLQTFELLSGDG